jgi:hypothetical protein
MLYVVFVYPDTCLQGTESFGPIGSPKRSKPTILSKAEGIAAGQSILGMLSQNQPNDNLELQIVNQMNIDSTKMTQQRQPKNNSRREYGPKDKLSKEQFKEAFVQCLESPSFLDQIYQAYAKKVQN